MIRTFGTRNEEVVMPVLPGGSRRGLLALLLTVVVGLLTPAGACADPPYIGPADVLFEKHLADGNVREELRLSKAQVKQLGALAEQYRKAADELNGRGLAGEQRQRAWRELYAAFNKRICTVLGPGQRRRLRQIHLQAVPFLAFEDEQVRKELGLSRKQCARVLQIVEDTKKRAERAIEESVAKGADSFADPAPIYAAGMKRIAEVLTDDQRVGWEVMLGRPVARK
jgi:hypothetical protein